MNIHKNHIPFSQLIDYVEQRLLPVEQMQLEGHIISCTQCAEELGRAQRMSKFLKTAEDAPPTVIQRAVDLFQNKPMPTPLLSGLRRQIRAILHFDRAGLAPAFGIRSGTAGARQLLFHADADKIDLRIEPAGQTWIISGQILGESAGGGTVALLGDARNSESVLNEMSEFILPPVQAGMYTLVFHLKEVDVEVSEIGIGM
jgi:hypothetical protein